jgi:geranylgeranyl reductase family protein
MRADVAVVGAGPAGCSAAITAARQGHSVVLIDKAEFPRDKCCGDGLTVGALRHLERLGLDPRDVPSWTDVDAATVSGPSRHVVTFPLPRGRGCFAAVARRLDLDVALVDVARRSGVAVLEGAGLVGVAHDTQSVALTLADDTEVRADYVMAADGMWSPTRKLLGLAAADYRGDWHAFRQYFTGVSDAAAHELTVWFEPDFLPGYAWSFPLGDGRANVGFGIQRGGSYEVGDMKHLWHDVLQRPHIRCFLGEQAEPEARHSAWPIPTGIDHLVPVAGRVLFVGDAVAAGDAMTGEGIGQALATGSWAAEAVTAAGAHHPEVARGRYEQRLQRELRPDHQMSDLLVRALRHRKGARAAVRVAGLTAWTRRNFARWLFEDYPRGLVFTPARWREHSLAGPGAFADGSIARNLAATSDT